MPGRLETKLWICSWWSSNPSLLFPFLMPSVLICVACLVSIHRQCLEHVTHTAWIKFVIPLLKMYAAPHDLLHHVTHCTYSANHTHFAAPGAPGQPQNANKGDSWLTPSPPPWNATSNSSWYRVMSSSDMMTKALLVFMSWQLWDIFSKFQRPIIDSALDRSGPLCVGSGHQLDWLDCWCRWQQSDAVWLLGHWLVMGVTGQCWRWFCRTRWLWFHV